LTEQGSQVVRRFCYPPHQHTCLAPAQHNLAWWIWRNPTTPLKFAAQDLHMKQPSIWVTSFRLKNRRDRDRLCPVCFSPSLFSGVCHTCGAETATGFFDVTVDFAAQSPVHRLLPLPLGTSNRIFKAMDQHRPKAPYGKAKGILQVLDETSDDQLETAIKSKVLQVLKGYYPPDQVSETAAIMIKSYVKFLRRTFPTMPTKPNWAINDCANLVLARLEQAYPALKGKLVPRHFRAT